MTGAAELKAQIDEATRRIGDSYGRALKAVEKLKEKMNELELRINGKEPPESSEDIDELSSTIEKLDRFTDSLILRSKRAWEEYGRLEHECKIQAFEHARIEDLKAICKKSEQLAADLLCYSLGYFKRKSE